MTSRDKEPTHFQYEEAFARNLGWVTPEEQQRLRGKRIAIAGMGGVGAIHLLTLARLGVGAFHVADFDCYDIPNLNRQAAAFMSTMGQPKVDVAARMAQDINPQIEIRRFGDGVNSANVSDFLDGVDLYVDGLDFYAFAARTLVYGHCAAQRIPATMAAPLGMGASCLNFLPGQMSFEDYFQWGDLPEVEKALRFLVGLAPASLHRGYLVWPQGVDLAQRRGPSTSMGCQLCAGIAASQALKILLGRGKVLAAPHGFQYDAYENRYVTTWRPGGNRHPLQRLAMALARRKFVGTAPARTG